MKIVACLRITGDARGWLPVVTSLLAQPEIVRIVVGGNDAGEAFGAIGSHPAISFVEQTDAACLVRDARKAEPEAAVLMVLAPVLAAPEAFGRCADLLDDLRVGTISFFSNAAGYLSLPHRNRETNHQIEDLDETGVNRRLRETAPALGVVPIPVATGPAVLISNSSIELLGFGCEGVHPSAHLAELSLAGQRRGLIAILDTSTFLVRPSDLAPLEPDVLAQSEVRAWLSHRHPFFEAGYHEAYFDPDSPLSIAHAASAAKIRGVRVLLDGTCLGPKEMGTQVQLLSLLKGLTEHSDVRSVCVAIPGAVPTYAEKVLGSSKVQLVVSDQADFSGVERGDVIHRPFQPDRPLPMDQWRSSADRVVITIQDLIGFEIGAYQIDGVAWTDYRNAMRRAVRQVDGVVVISNDSADQVRRNQMSVASNRIFVVPNGTDHLAGTEEGVIPEELVRRGFIASPFLLVVGANYSHKNRDLAIEVWKELRQRGFNHRLVLVGAAVPHGSSRWEEARSLGYEPSNDVLAVPDVDSSGRNWLLRHADAVLYPTAAEGFGLIPFEAARFGTPTVSVRFGPLLEVSPNNPVTAKTWSPTALADAAQTLLMSPSERAAQVQETLRAGTKYTWSNTAHGLLESYRALLGLPTR